MVSGTKATLQLSESCSCISIGVAIGAEGAIPSNADAARGLWLGAGWLPGRPPPLGGAVEVLHELQPTWSTRLLFGFPVRSS